MNDYVLTVNDDGDLAMRTVPAVEDSNVTDTTSVITRTDDGKLAVRVVGGGDSSNLGYFATLEALQEAHPTAEPGNWAIVGTTDTVWIWDSDTSAWIDSDQKGQVTSVNNQTGAVTVQETLVSGTNIKTINNTSLLGAGDLTIDSLPSQSGNTGKFLTTDGSSASWANVDALPTQTGQNGKFLTTNGSTASWADVDSLPSQTGNAGKFLQTDGTDASWGSITTTPATPPTLVAANWSSNTQTITVQGVTATNTIVVGPIPTDAEDYATAGILCTAQATNSLTFTCQTTPATDLQVNIVIM